MSKAMTQFAVLDYGTGKVSVCEVYSTLKTSYDIETFRLCSFKAHVAGAPWPDTSTSHWILLEYLFDSALPALAFARSILKDRIGDLSLNLDSICETLEGPAPEPIRTSIWDLIRRPV